MNEYKLIKCNYVLNPQDYYKYVLLNCIFRNNDHTVNQTFTNDIIATQKALFALVTLTAWTIKFEKGCGVKISLAYSSDNKKTITIHYIDKKTKAIKKALLTERVLPSYIKEAYNIIWDELQSQFNNTLLLP